MNTLVPVVRYTIVCENVVKDPAKVHSKSLLGLVNHLLRENDAAPPYLLQECCVFLQFTGCRGPGQGRIELHHADSDRRVFQSPNMTINLANNPLSVQSLTWRFKNLPFPQSGLYEVQFWYNDTMLAQHPILVK